MNRGLRTIVFTLIVGLVLGAVLHLGIVLALPRLGTSSAFQRFAATTLPFETTPFTPPQADPAVELSACRFDLAAGPARVRAPARDLVESVSIHAMHGGVVYALSDRGASGGMIDLTLMTRRQFDEAQAQDDVDQPNQHLRVTVPEQSGLAVLRVVVPFESRRAQARELADGLSCVAASP